MATKKRVKKSASKKAPQKKTAKKTAKKPAAKGPVLVDPKTLKSRPRPRRVSKFDETAKLLLANPGKAIVIALPKGKKPEVYRTMLYTRLAKCIDYFKPKHGKKVSISILENNDLGVRLVKA